MEQYTDFTPCTKPFLLCELREGQTDKLGHRVEEIFWIGQKYAVYRSEKGVYVQFSDCPREEAAQRSKFTKISPELCELRYLTYEMRTRAFSLWRHALPPSSLYEHNMAQAVMLVMEEKVDQGMELAKQSLKMAVTRVTNDNTVKYFVSALLFCALSIAVGSVILWWKPSDFVVAAMCGAAGAVFSVAIHLNDFQLHPCQQSEMNHWMACSRIGIGLVSGALLLLLGLTILKQPIDALFSGAASWQQAVILGVLGGFAERLVPNLLKQASGKIEPPAAGTPVQAIRGAPT